MTGFLAKAAEFLKARVEAFPAEYREAQRRVKQIEAQAVEMPQADKKAALYGVGMPSDLSSPAAMATAMYLNGACTARHAVLMGAAGAPDGRGGFRMAYGGRGR